MDITKKQIYSYITGFFDGEGCILIYRNYHRKHPQYLLKGQISNTCKEVLLWISSYTGGRIETIERKEKKHQTCYVLILCGKYLYKFLKNIYPYSIVKKPQIEVALRFIKTITNNRRVGLKQEVLNDRENMKQELKYLKRHYTIN